MEHFFKILKSLEKSQREAVQEVMSRKPLKAGRPLTPREASDLILELKQLIITKERAKAK